MHLSSQFMLLFVLVGAAGQLDLGYDNDGFWVLRQPMVQPKARQAVGTKKREGSLAGSGAQSLDYENDGTWVLRNMGIDEPESYPRPQEGCGIGAQECALSVTSGPQEQGESLEGSVVGAYTPVACLAGRPVYLRLYSPKGQDRLLWWDSASTAWVISPGVKPRQGAALATGSGAGEEGRLAHEVLQWVLPAKNGASQGMAAQLKVECTHNAADTSHASAEGLPPNDTAAAAAVVVALPGKAPKPGGAGRARHKPVSHDRSSGGVNPAGEVQHEQVGAAAARRLAGGVSSKAASEQVRSSATGDGAQAFKGSNTLPDVHVNSFHAGPLDKLSSQAAPFTVRHHFTLTLLAVEALAGVFLAGLAVGWLLFRAKSSRPSAGAAAAAAASPHKKPGERRDSLAISPARSGVSWRGARSPQTSHQLPDRPAADRA